MSNASEVGKSFHPLKESPEVLNYPVPWEHSAVSRQCPEPTNPPLSVDDDDLDASLFHECPAIPRLDPKVSYRNLSRFYRAAMATTQIKPGSTV